MTHKKLVPFDLDKWCEMIKGNASVKEGLGVTVPPNVFYNRDGDMLEVFLADEVACAEWLNSDITILRGRKTKKIVGIQISGIRKLMRRSFYRLLEKKTKRTVRKLTAMVEPNKENA